MAGAARKGEGRVGAMFRCSLEPELLRSYARGVEELGYDELWIVEDCFYAGGIASAAAALAATERITMGLGILPAVLRNPAATAMELATLPACSPAARCPGWGTASRHGCTRSAPCHPRSSPRSARRSAPSAPCWPARRSLRTAPTSTWTRCAWTTRPAARRRSWRACAGHGRSGPGRLGHRLAVTGEPGDRDRAVRAFVEAGADAVVLAPPPEPGIALDQLEQAATQLRWRR